MTRPRAIIWGVLAALVVVLLLGLFVPNQQLQRVAFFWWRGWVMPVWGLMALCVVTGAAIAAALMGLAWFGERSRRVHSERRAQAIDGEVAELRRLLAREAGPEGDGAGTQP